MWDLEIEAEVSLLNKWQRYSFHISCIFVLRFVVTWNEKKSEKSVGRIVRLLLLCLLFSSVD